MIWRYISLALLAGSALTQEVLRPREVTQDGENCPIFNDRFSNGDGTADRFEFDIVTGDEEITFYNILFEAGEDFDPGLEVNVLAFRQGSFQNDSVLDFVARDIIIDMSVNAGGLVDLGGFDWVIAANSRQGFVLEINPGDNNNEEIAPLRFTNAGNVNVGAALAEGDVFFTAGALSLSTGLATRRGADPDNLGDSELLHAAICFSVGEGEPLLANFELSPGEEPVLPTPSDASGRVVMTYDPANRYLEYDLSFMDLTGVATALHFHGPAPRGQNAGVQITLDETDNDIFFIDATQESQLLDDMWYFNIHTAANPDGELRGQVELRSVVNRNLISLTPEAVEIGGGNINLTIAAAASGRANVTLDRNTLELTWSVSFEGLSGNPTLVSLNGPASVTAEAAIQVTLQEDPPFLMPIEGAVTVTQDQADDIDDGMWYLLVSTAQNSDGELRGQVDQVPTPSPTLAPTPMVTPTPTTILGLSNSILLTEEAFLLGGGELDNNDTGSGQAQVDYNQMTGELSWNLQFSGLSSEVTRINFHGPANETAEAEVVLGIAVENAVSPVIGSVFIPVEDANDLVDELWYIRVDTIENDDGELRGQVVQAPTPAPTPPPLATMEGQIVVNFAEISLTTDAEVAAGTPIQSASNGIGWASVYLSEDNVLGWEIEYQDLTGPTTAAHFHGPADMYSTAGVRLVISGDSFTTPETGVIAISPDLAAELLNGSWYINIHTMGNPMGEIRGQVTPFERRVITNPFEAEEVNAAQALKACSPWLAVAVILAIASVLN